MKTSVRTASAGFVIFAFVWVSCSTVPITGRKQLNLVSPQQEMQLGLTSFEKMKQQVAVSKDPAANALLQKVGKSIAAVAAHDMPDAQWEFVVFQSKEANAFCLPGGKVGVYTGLLPITRDEAGLATVIGHEVAHAVARHGGERMTRAMALQTGGEVIGALSSSAQPITQTMIGTAYALGAQVGVELPFDRKQESEADHIGLIFMARAGYDPHSAVDFWKRFSQFNQQSGRAGPPALLRTHPVDEVRIKQIEAWMDEAMKEYKSPGSSAPARGSDIIGRKIPAQ
jgi:metalloendopeptidase OMA1, mitochondrial